MSARLRLHLPILLLVIFALLAALWAALLRVGWQMPPLPIPIAGQHGALMVSAFLGTLVSLERAVALQKRWAYAAPFLSAFGGLALLIGWQAIGRGLMTFGALGLVIIFVVIYRLHPTIDIGSMALGSGLWLIGNGLWFSGQPIYYSSPWWAGFLILTIAGERLELSRVLLTKPISRTIFKIVLAVFTLGLIVTLFEAIGNLISSDVGQFFVFGLRVSGVGLILFGLWLLRYDVARVTIRKTGLTRFIAACLLPGYVWLIVGGALWLISAGSTAAGYYYDAMLHTLFLGFVFSMIFGHAPIILPAVMPVEVHYRSSFYLHLVLLQLSLGVRVAGDLVQSLAVRQWAGLFNVIAILLFLGNTARSVSRRRE
jgi:hypothetical protein